MRPVHIQSASHGFTDEERSKLEKLILEKVSAGSSGQELTISTDKGSYTGKVIKVAATWEFTLERFEAKREAAKAKRAVKAPAKKKAAPKKAPKK